MQGVMALNSPGWIIVSPPSVGKNPPSSTGCLYSAKKRTNYHAPHLAIVYNLFGSITKDQAMKTLTVLTIFFSALSAHAAQIICQNEGAQVYLQVSIDGAENFTTSISNFEITRALLTIPSQISTNGNDIKNEPAFGGAGWDTSEGLIAVRSASTVLVIRLKPWTKDGVASGMVEQGAGPNRLLIVCNFVNTLP
jgi:hypothetical protein